MSVEKDKELYLNFDELIRKDEPSQREAAYARRAIAICILTHPQNCEYIRILLPQQASRQV